MQVKETKCGNLCWRVTLLQHFDTAETRSGCSQQPESVLSAPHKSPSSTSAEPLRNPEIYAGTSTRQLGGGKWIRIGRTSKGKGSANGSLGTSAGTAWSAQSSVLMQNRLQQTRNHICWLESGRWIMVRRVSTCAELLAEQDRKGNVGQMQDVSCKDSLKWIVESDGSLSCHVKAYFLQFMRGHPVIIYHLLN